MAHPLQHRTRAGVGITILLIALAGLGVDYWKRGGRTPNQQPIRITRPHPMTLSHGLKLQAIQEVRFSVDFDALSGPPGSPKTMHVMWEELTFNPGNGFALVVSDLGVNTQVFCFPSSGVGLKSKVIQYTKPSGSNVIKLLVSPNVCGYTSTDAMSFVIKLN